MKVAAPRIKKMTAAEIDQFEQEGSVNLNLGEGEEIRLSDDDVEIIRSGLHGWSVETEEGLTVAVDTSMTPELIDEGLAREFINRVQNMRKEADFEVTDRIHVSYEGQKQLCEAIDHLSEYVASETLAVELIEGKMEVSDYTKEWEIDGGDCTIAIKRNLNF